MGSRWIRLDTTWSSSAWVADLSPEARLAWVELLCYVKAHGYAGAAKRLAPSVFARVTGVTRNAIEEMEERAQEDEALAIDEGEWIITAWGDYQTDKTAAERMRRYRERQQQDTEAVTNPPVTEVTRNVTAPSPTVTKTETVTNTVDRWPTKPPKEGGQYAYPDPFERAWSVYPSRDGSNPKIGAYKAFRARVQSGDDPDDLIKAATHYRKHCRSREQEGTPYVQQAATFWGPSEPWREFIETPNGNGTHRVRKVRELDEETAAEIRKQRDNPMTLDRMMGSR